MALDAIDKKQWHSKGGQLNKFVKKRIPITAWLPNYNSEKFFNDAIAGITVGLTVMPQGLAYATLAGLEPQVNNYFLNKNLQLIYFFNFVTFKITKYMCVCFIVWSLFCIYGSYGIYSIWFMQGYHNWTHCSYGIDDS